MGLEQRLGPRHGKLRREWLRAAKQAAFAPPHAKRAGALRVRRGLNTRRHHSHVELATDRHGVFRATYQFTSRTRRFRMRVAITAGSDTGAYIVRFRIVNRPSGLIAIVYGISPAPMSAAAAPPKHLDASVRHR